MLDAYIVFNYERKGCSNFEFACSFEMFENFFGR